MCDVVTPLREQVRTFITQSASLSLLAMVANGRVHAKIVRANRPKSFPLDLTPTFHKGFKMDSEAPVLLGKLVISNLTLTSITCILTKMNVALGRDILSFDHRIISNLIKSRWYEDKI